MVKLGKSGVASCWVYRVFHTSGNGEPRYSRGRVLAAVDPAEEMRGLLITMENNKF